MDFNITPFDPRHLDQLNLMPPETWQSNAYDLFIHNEWQPWFHPYQVIDQQKLVGFGMLFHFGEVAWFGWILVHKKYRNRGIGTAISKHLMQESSRLGATTFLLTASEMGAPIYEKLGFRTTSYYQIFSPPLRLKTNFDRSKIRHATTADMDSIAELDFKATGELRTPLLQHYINETLIFEDTKPEGFFIPTLGNGLLIANTTEAGNELFKYRLRKNKRLVGLPEQNKSFIDILTESGFKEESRIPRMTFGSEPSWNPELIYCRAAGYCG